jgi:hypothetical protein
MVSRDNYGPTWLPPTQPGSLAIPIRSGRWPSRTTASCGPSWTTGVSVNGEKMPKYGREEFTPRLSLPSGLSEIVGPSSGVRLSSRLTPVSVESLSCLKEEKGVCKEPRSPLLSHELLTSVTVKISSLVRTVDNNNVEYQTYLEPRRNRLHLGRQL